jgi:hypothetical protein
MSNNLPPLPDWLLNLRSTPEAQSGIHWHTDEEVRELHSRDREEDSHLDLYGRIATEHDGSLEEEANELLARVVPVGVAVTGGRFSARNQIMRTQSNFPAEFWFDPSSPDSLLCSLNAKCPPHFWVPVGQTLESIGSGLAIYYRDVPQEPAEGPAAYARRLRSGSAGRDVPTDWTTTRMLLGVIGDMREIENAMIFRSGFCRSFESLATANSDQIAPATTFHTVNSFSRISLEYHSWLSYSMGGEETGSPVVAEVTYPLASHANLIRRYNQALDTDFPLEIPVDVVAALFGYPVKGLPRLHGAMTPDDAPGNITFVMGFLAATEGDDAVLLARFQEFSTHPDPNVRARVGRYACVRQHPELAQQMASVEENASLKEYLQGLLQPTQE